MSEENTILITQFLELQKYSMGNENISVSYECCDWEKLISLSYKNKCSILFNNAVNKKHQS